ncbi:MAG TPA: RDD family protein [Acidobacteriaceae bacterium]
MSTQPAAQLTFEPANALPSAAEAHSAASSALKEQAASRLAAHRARHAAPAPAPKQVQTNAVPAKGKSAAVAAAVAARYARAQSYRDFLAEEAEEALRRAEAAAEIATRNAEAIAAERQQLLAELEQWNAPAPELELVAPAQSTAAPVEIAENAEPIAPPFQLEAVLPAELETVQAQASAYTYNTAPQIEEQDFAAEAADFLAYSERIPPTPIPANLIEFPRVLVATRKARPRLAEGPLREEADEAAAQLRIFEVESVSPEPAPSTALPEWSSIRLDAAVRHDAHEHPDTPAPAYTIPIQTAEIAPRVHAFAADSALVGAATLAFAAIVGYMAQRSGLLPDKKLAAIALVAVFFLLKLIYQMLFFTLNESTPGMRMARIGVCTFNDDNPTRSELRRRVGATLLASCPMGLGLIWAWFDVDRLGWHDRMTRTYPRSY